MAMTIDQASAFVAELLDVLEDLYWESSSIPVKNQCFNAVRLLQAEVTELTKISVQDHHYEYEIIACPPHIMIGTLDRLKELLKDEVMRTRTQALLEPLMAQTKQILG